VVAYNLFEATTSDMKITRIGNGDAYISKRKAVIFEYFMLLTDDMTYYG
jgi:hypothetical protein